MTQINEETSFNGELCPIVEAIKRISGMWKLVVVRYLLEGPMGFNELLRRIDGISSKTLSATLKQLQKEGIVRREILSTQPFSVKYYLTEKGEELKPVIEALRYWGEKWIKTPQNLQNVANIHNISNQQHTR